MSPLDQPKNHAARMGRWSAAHWKTATFGWLGFVIVAFLLGGQIGTKNIDENASGPGESGRAAKILDAGFKQPAGESVLIQSRSMVANDPAFRAAVEDVVARISKLEAIQNVRSPLEPANAGQIAKNRHAALVEFQIRGDSDKAAEKIDPVVDAIADAQTAHPQLFIGGFGDASASKALEAANADDLKRAGLFSVPITLLILLIAFGALVAAGIPLLLALTAVIATLGLIALPSQLLPVAPDVSAIVLLVGLAVGVDYSMFYLKREREERAAGRSEEAALEAAAATSGRSVLVSGLTVIVAMAGMLLTGDVGFASFGVATMTVVAVAMLGSLTVLPALLSKLGDNVDRVRVPFVHRLRRNDGEGRIWGAIIDRVLRRPILSVVLAGGLLLAIAAPAVQLHTAQPSIDTYPQKLLGSYNRLKAAFPGTEIGASVIIKAPSVEAPAVQKAIGEVKRRALATGVMNEPIDVDLNAAKTVAVVSIPVEGDGTDVTSNQALAALRDEIIPQTLGTLAGAEVAVTGLTAQSKDFNEQMKTATPLVFGFVLL